MYTETNVQETEQDLFSAADVFNYQDASLGQRFLNLVIDYIALHLTVGVAVGFVEGIVLGVLFPAVGAEVYGHKGFEYYVFAWISGAISYLIYYTFCETVFKGCTLGKLVTGTKALRTDGSQLSIRDAFMRSLCRLIPFEPLSAFGPQPWHDSMTDTMVVKSR